MDISQIDFGNSNTGIDMILIHPVSGLEIIDTETSEPVTLKVVGAESDVYKEAQRRITNQKLSKAKGKKDISFTAEELEAFRIQLIAACIRGWSHIGLGEAKELPYSEQNAKRLLVTAPWILEQVETFVGDRANFTQKK